MYSSTLNNDDFEYGENRGLYPLPIMTHFGDQYFAKKKECIQNAATNQVNDASAKKIESGQEFRGVTSRTISSLPYVQIIYNNLVYFV